MKWRAHTHIHSRYTCIHPHVNFFWWVLQHCTGCARLVWGRLRVHRAFIYSNWFVCSVCFCSLLPRLTLPLSFLDILHCLPRAVGVPLESALNLVSPMSPCGEYRWNDAHTHIYTHATLVFTHMYIHMYLYRHTHWYGVALVSRMDKILGLFCKRDL